MTAGSGSEDFRRAVELEALMIKQYGSDFRDKAIAGPLGSFRLADAFEECGPTDPQRPRDSGAYGLWQMISRPRD
jgi:hypothetical protein